ncbi:hypothetical protein GW17_00044046 [Ensete ventricosum]|nr:hypothetical protein GW17_00044046 [Ensete ventricosum]RZR83906.1 hypothetical protein BHM03_00010615 [Ensete ventricosum]
MTEGNRLADFFAFLLAVLTNRGIRTVGLTNSPIFFPQLYFSRPIDLASKPETTGLEKQSTHSAPVKKLVSRQAMSDCLPAAKALVSLVRSPVLRVVTSVAQVSTKQRRARRGISLEPRKGRLKSGDVERR